MYLPDNRTDTIYALLVNEPLTMSSEFAYQASTLAVTSTCRSLAPDCLMSPEQKDGSDGTLIKSVNCSTGMSWDWNLETISNAPYTTNRPTQPVWPLGQGNLNFSYTSSLSATVPLGLKLFTDPNFSTLYDNYYDFDRDPMWTILSQHLDPLATLDGRFYAVVVGTFYGALTYKQFRNDADFYFPVMKFIHSGLPEGQYSHYIGFGFGCEIAFVNASYSFDKGVYTLMNITEDVPQEVYGAWALYAESSYVNSITPPPAGQISVAAGISDSIWTSVSSPGMPAEDFTAAEFRLGVESAVRRTAATWLNGVAAQAPAMVYQSRTSWPLATRVPKAPLYTLVVLNCFYSLLGVVVSLVIVCTFFQDWKKGQGQMWTFKVAELFSVKGLATSLSVALQAGSNHAGSIGLDAQHAQTSTPAFVAAIAGPPITSTSHLFQYMGTSSAAIAVPHITSTSHLLQSMGSSSISPSPTGTSTPTTTAASGPAP